MAFWKPNAFEKPGSTSQPSRFFPAVTSLIILCIAAAGSFVVLYSDSRDSLVRIREGGSLRIGYAIEAPYAFVTDSGTVTGEGPEIAKAAVAALGFSHVEWRRIDFSSLLGALENGRIDVIAAGMFITPERAKVVRFSLPTFQAHQGLLVRRSSADHRSSYLELANVEGDRIAVLAGSIEEEYFLSLGFGAGRLLTVPNAEIGRAAVAEGLAYGLALSAPTVRWIAAHDPTRTTMAEEPFRDSPGTTGDEGAFAFRQDDVSLWKAWNRFLSTYLGSPEHLALVSRFGFSSSDIPLGGEEP